MTLAEKEKDDTVVEQYSSSSSAATVNGSVDYWRYDIDVNVIPADTKQKAISTMVRMAR
jgi:hypothetical protein